MKRLIVLASAALSLCACTTPGIFVRSPTMLPTDKTMGQLLLEDIQNCNRHYILSVGAPTVSGSADINCAPLPTIVPLKDATVSQLSGEAPRTSTPQFDAPH